jgi:hypothetical protein
MAGSERTVPTCAGFDAALLLQGPLRAIFCSAATSRRARWNAARAALAGEYEARFGAAGYGADANLKMASWRNTTVAEPTMMAPGSRCAPPGPASARAGSSSRPIHYSLGNLNLGPALTGPRRGPSAKRAGG